MVCYETPIYVSKVTKSGFAQPNRTKVTEEGRQSVVLGFSGFLKRGGRVCLRALDWHNICSALN